MECMRLLSPNSSSSAAGGSLSASRFVSSQRLLFSSMTLKLTTNSRSTSDGSPADVDRELVVNFSVMDENSSLWEETYRLALSDPPAADDEEFGESNLMHSINGYVYGNLPGLTMKKGERVRWYVMAMGTEVDLHTPHWHGNTVVANGMREDVVQLLPASMLTADMQPDNVGTWLFHCHVNDHIAAGMMSLYTVTL